MTNVDKRIALKVLPDHYENRLFFAARNLAIEAVMLRLEGLLLRKGFDCAASWAESSFSAPCLELRLANPKPSQSSWEFAHAFAYLNRETIAVPRDKGSACFYSLKSVEAWEHCPGRESKYVLGFRDAVQALADSGHFASEIEKLNFPFDHDHHSSF